MWCCSNDDFLLHYGFVPDGNMHDDYILFDSIDAALHWHRSSFATKACIGNCEHPWKQDFRAGQARNY